jgi:hypothetical protein
MLGLSDREFQEQQYEYNKRKMETLPNKRLSIHAIDGYETYMVDDYTIGVRHIWFDAIKQPPIACVDVLLYADDRIVVGWNESTQPEEDPVYCVSLAYSRSATRLDDVTHWMHIPMKPENKENNVK